MVVGLIYSHEIPNVLSTIVVGFYVLINKYIYIYNIVYILYYIILYDIILYYIIIYYIILYCIIFYIYIYKVLQLIWGLRAWILGSLNCTIGTLLFPLGGNQLVD